MLGTSGADLFDGKGAPAGSSDYEQGNGGADTFVYRLGYGQLQIVEGPASYYDRSSTSAVLQLGTGLTLDRLRFSSDDSGNVTLTDGLAGDRVLISGMLNLTYGVAQSGIASVLLAAGHPCPGPKSSILQEAGRAVPTS